LSLVWVAERRAQIELFYLPSYSPQLNPEERVIGYFQDRRVRYAA